MRTLGLLLLAIATGCAPARVSQSVPPAAPPAHSESVWMMKDYALGVQCGPDGAAAPPDTGARLAALGVQVHEIAVVPLGVGAVCGAPSYVAQHYARIDAAGAEAARLDGFAQTAPPPPAERLDLVWLEARLSLGRQCSPSEVWTRADVLDGLRLAGIAVYGFTDRSRPVCRSCDCASYAANARILVSRSDAPDAGALGFHPGRRPY